MSNSVNEDGPRDTTAPMRPMSETLRTLLRCARCRGALRLSDGERLTCIECGTAFQIRNGIPRFTGPEQLDDAARRTQDSFGYEWTHFNDWTQSGQTNFDDYFDGLDLTTLRDARVLDGGCGMGRHARMLAEHVDRLVAVDFSIAIEQAARNTAIASNVDCVQADLLALPFANNTFDYVYSMGVLHHLRDPGAGLASLVRTLKPSGRLRVYLYWKRRGVAGAILAVVSAMRTVTTRMPLPLLRAFTLALSAVLWLVVIVPARLLRHLKIQETWDLPLLAYTKYNFSILHNDQFDRFSAPIERRFDAEEVKQLLEAAGLRDVNVFAKYGWIAEGTKCLVDGDEPRNRQAAEHDHRLTRVETDERIGGFADRESRAGDPPQRDITLRPRVAIILVGDSMSGSGGAERRFIRLWRALRHGSPEPVLILNASLFKSAVESGLCTADDQGEDCRVLPDANILALNLSIYRNLRDSGCGIVHLPLLQKRLLPLYLLLFASRDLLITHTVTSSFFAHPGNPPKTLLALGRVLWKFSDRIDSLYEGFVEAYAVPGGFAHKVTVSPCSFTDLTKSATETEKTNTIVFAGRLDDEKNPLLFIESLELLKGRPDWRAVVAGDGPLKSEVAMAIAKRDLQQRVEMGLYPDLSAVLAKSAVFVSIQRTENYPSQSLLEAMAARNATVATSVGATARLIEHGRTGILIEASARQLADAVARLLDDVPARTAMGRLAREKIVSEHSLARFAEYMRALWMDLGRSTRRRQIPEPRRQ